MFRAILLYLSRARWMKSLVTHWGLARRVARRFVAGETEDDAIAVIRKLNGMGITATVDILGENTTNAAEARRAADAYLHLIDRIPQEKLDSWVSVKLTALGLDVDPQVCLENMRGILDCARQHDIRVTIDMEDHTYTDRTLDMLRGLRKEGFKNAQGVIQSYLYRSEQDIPALANEGLDIRLCKGAYREPASVAYPKKRDVDEAYARLMKTLLDAARGGGGYPGIATHDPRLIEETRDYVGETQVDRVLFEFQMLYGVRPGLQEELIRDGYRLRVYVPFGSQWYPYLMRRLAERPANVWFFVSSLFRR